MCPTGMFDISIYESDILGGQASSKKSKLCNTEISWRVFGNYYTNLMKLQILYSSFSNIIYSIKNELDKIFDLGIDDTGADKHEVPFCLDLF